jgi:hypothetical protein
MKAMSKFWTALVVGVAVGVTFLWTTPAKAGPLTVDIMDWSSFSSNYLGSLFAPAVTDYFDFAPANDPTQSPYPPVPYDGEVISTVYLGKPGSSAEGLYVYLYQLKIYPSSSASFISGIAFDLLTPIPPALVDGKHVINIGDAPILFGSANTSSKVGSADWGLNFPPTTSQISFDLNPKLYKDDTPPYEDMISYVWAFFHPLPPTLISSNPKDGGSDLRNPLVYTPSPEPSTFLLLGFGLLGLVGSCRRKKA